MLEMINRIKTKFFQYYTSKHRLIQKPKFESIPVGEIGYGNVKNARLLASREQMLSLLPKNGVVAELGVDHGDLS